MDYATNYIHCPKCWKTFENSEVLIKHLQEHTPCLSFMRKRHANQNQPFYSSMAPNSELNSSELQEDQIKPNNEENFKLTKQHARYIKKFISRYLNKKDVPFTKINLVKAINDGPYELVIDTEPESEDDSDMENRNDASDSEESQHSEMSTSDEENIDEDIAYFMREVCDFIKRDMISMDYDLYLKLVKSLDIDD